MPLSNRELMEVWKATALSYEEDYRRYTDKYEQMYKVLQRVQWLASGASAPYFTDSEAIDLIHDALLRLQVKPNRMEQGLEAF